MGDLILVDFKGKKLECTFKRPEDRAEIKALRANLEASLKLIMRCTNDKKFLELITVFYQDILNKCKDDIL